MNFRAGLALLVAGTMSLLWGCGARHSAEQILGCPLPPSATDIRFADKAGMFGGDYYVSAAMPASDFTNLLSRLNLRHRPDLLEYWSRALHAQSTPWWTVTVTNDHNTVFGERPSTYLVARYEKGRLYFKCHVY